MQPLLRGSFIVIIGLVGIVIQGTILKVLFGMNFFVPHLMLVLVTLLAFIEPNPFGAVMSFFLGLISDLASAVLLGPWAAAFVVVFFVVSFFAQNLFYESAITAFCAVLVACVIASGVYLSLELQFKAIDSSLLSLSWALLLESVVTACLAPLLFPFLGRILYQRNER